MLALHFEDKLELREVEAPQPQAGEALIRVRLAGICQTDVEVTRGYKDFKGILGHEFVGQVVAAGESAWIGQRVVGEINIGCGHCRLCKVCLSGHCPQRQVLGLIGRHGAMAEFLTLPLANLHLIPAEVPDAFAVFTEPLAATLEVLEQVHVGPTSKVLIVGDGKLGLLTALALRLHGCDLHLVGRHPAKLNLVGFRGVTTHLAEAFQERDFDLVVEASGSPSGWATAVQAVRPRGTIVLKTTYHQDLSFNPSNLVVREISLVGSRCGPFAPALRLLARRLVNPRRLISRIYPLSQALAAFDYARQKGVLKVLLEVSSHEV